ncbi:cytochrome P450 [Aspergillus lucknowensis]|uniref:Cytochrome P450 n=1 Tax=Aspergillus lucknowensis TaxID=176173 RepID=A0ABR4LI98_9EURO
MLLWIAVLTSLPLLTVYLLERTRYFRFKQYARYPQLSPSLLWGHMKALDAVMGQGDRRRHIDQVFLEVDEQLNHPPLFVVDLRPVLHVICVICSHEVAEQISRSTKALPYSVPKGNSMDIFMPLMGPNSLLSADGNEWKSLRKLFNPGFAPQHLVSLLPCILDKVQRFIDILDQHAASREVVSLDKPCINLTFDVIGAVTMDEDLRAQCGPSSQSEIVTVFRQLVETFRADGGTSWDQFKVRTRLHRQRLSKQLDTILRRRVKEKHQEWQTRASTDTKKSRSVLALSLEGVEHLDPDTLDKVSDQIKTFLFAGHDTTSSMLQWAFYELSRTPHALAAVREELDQLFGPQSASSTDDIRKQLLSSRGESLLSRMSYTAAVIKETLRLHPPAGSARTIPVGTGFHVTLPDGQSLCLDGMILHNCETIIQRDERVYGPTKDAFVPERWLDRPGSKDDSSGIPVSAWRPFERGPRNCIGQELANLEARVVFACTLRRYTFTKVGLGAIRRDSEGQPVLGPFGQYEVESELFNIMEVTGKPVDRTQMRIERT